MILSPESEASPPRLILPFGGWVVLVSAIRANPESTFFGERDCHG